MQKGNPTIITGIIVLLVILATAAFITKRAEAPVDGVENETVDTTQTTQIGTSTSTDTSVETDKTEPTNTADNVVIVTYTKNGFSPQEITIGVGDTVRFENESGPNMWVASAFHPTHMIYSDTSLNEHCPDPDNTTFDACGNFEAGTHWDFTFTKVGEWGYHNHSRANHFGKVIVQ